jgi:hypothetical protein
MNVQAQIDSYIADQPEPKRGEMLDLHRRITAMSPGCRLWFLDGRNSDGKVISNPNVGYGLQTIRYANGEEKEFYKVGFCANATGLSVYVMTIDDKRYLAETYGSKLGKAKITGYCIRFKTTRDLDMGVLEDLIADAMKRRQEPST